jgi:hypothetical protein
MLDVCIDGIYRQSIVECHQSGECSAKDLFSIANRKRHSHPSGIQVYDCRIAHIRNPVNEVSTSLYIGKHNAGLNGNGHVAR